VFFKKLFNKDYRFYQDRGEKFLAEEKFADARHEFQEALLRLPDDLKESTDAGLAIRSRLIETGKRLALLNLSEAEHAVNREDFAKAAEHLDLAEDLSADAVVRERVEYLRESLNPKPPVAETGKTGKGCSGCTSETAAASEGDLVPDYLSAQERFELLVQTLPVSLQARYAALGEKFVSGYLMVHGGEEATGLTILNSLMNENENDILLYETALTHFRAGNKDECEKLIRRAFDMNRMNPLCSLALVQLLTDSGRLEESLPILHHMVENQLMTEQSLLFLGDVNHALGDYPASIESYSKALDYPNASKAAAQRLIPIFEDQGRREEASYLAKRYLKGCC